MKHLYRTIVFIFSLFLFAKGIAQTSQVMDLYDGLPPNSRDIKGLTNSEISTPIGKIIIRVVKPTLTVYLPSAEKSTGAAVVICPGGGYGVLALLEGDTIAKRFAAIGVAGIVLQYRLPDPLIVMNKEIVPLQDAQHALIVVRKHAKQWKIDPAKVGIMGSSAGGHLASTIGTHYEKKYDAHADGNNVRPDFMILNYPVISFADTLTHIGSRFNLVGPVLDSTELQRIRADWQNQEKEFARYPIAADKIAEYSNELHVNAKTPPTFIIHANDDDVVKIQNSILFMAALQKNGVDVQAFFYASGGHGFGIDNKSSDMDWFDACVKWLKSKGWLNK